MATFLLYCLGYLALGFVFLYIATLVLNETLFESTAGEIVGIILWPLLMLLLMLITLIDWWEDTVWPLLDSKVRHFNLLPSRAAKATRDAVENHRESQAQKNKLHVLEASDRDLQD